MNTDHDNTVNQALMAYLEQALAPDERQALQDRLDRDPQLRATLDGLRAQQAALETLGADLRAAAPSIHVRDAVMARVAASGNVVALEAELSALGGALIAQAPRVNMVASVMRRLSEAPAPHGGQLEMELRAIGEEIRAHAPRINVAEEVNTALGTAKLVRFRPNDARKAARRRAPLISWQVVAAAAACLVFGLAFILSQMLQPEILGTVEVVSRTMPLASGDARPTTAGRPVERQGDPLPFESVPATDTLAMLSGILRPADNGAPTGTEDEDQQASEIFDDDDIIAVRRNILAGQPDALLLLARMGTLDPDTARRLIETGQLTSEALAGLSRFLAQDEARSYIEQAVEAHPDDAYLRYILAKQLMDLPDRQDDAMMHLAAFRDLDPYNSLPYYMDAQMRLTQGDVSGALQMLEYAASFDTGSAHALMGAQNHSLALQTAGFPLDTAQMLAAFNAGMDEFQSINRLRADLLSYGAYFEELADYDTALAIYKAVNQMGAQLTEGATFTYEELAGLDAQMAAIDAMSALAQFLQIPGGFQTVEIAYAVFAEGISAFMEHTNLLEDMVNAADNSYIAQAVRQIMRGGEIAFAEKGGR